MSIFTRIKKYFFTDKITDDRRRKIGSIIYELTITSLRNRREIYWHANFCLNEELVAIAIRDKILEEANKYGEDVIKEHYIINNVYLEIIKIEKRLWARLV